MLDRDCTKWTIVTGLYVTDVKSVACDEQDELFTTVWPILIENIQNSTFKKCDKPKILYDIALGWTHGQTYDGLFRIASGADLRIVARTQRRRIKLDSIIDICDNGLSYDGTLVIGAIAEIIELLRPEDSGELVVKLLELQKRLKYGLSAPISIALYELGFSDRVVSMDLTCPPKRSPVIMLVNLDKKRGDKWPEKPTLRKRSSTS